MQCRVQAVIYFDVEIPVESDAAGWQTETKGERLDEQRQMWERNIPQLFEFVNDAKRVQLQLQITQATEPPTPRAQELRRQMESAVGEVTTPPEREQT
jgi:hypothetical protein